MYCMPFLVVTLPALYVDTIPSGALRGAQMRVGTVVRFGQALIENADSTWEFHERRHGVTATFATQSIMTSLAFWGQYRAGD